MRHHQRHLAGPGSPIVEDESTPEPRSPAELRLLAELDDVRGNGVFDAPGSRAIQHADAGVFAARYGVPGYLDREVVETDSEVLDATTGRPVRYVNGGAVAMDSAARIAMAERGRYAAPRPLLRSGGGIPSESIVNVAVPAAPVSGMGSLSLGSTSLVTMLGVGLAVGVAAGALLALGGKR